MPHPTDKEFIYGYEAGLKKAGQPVAINAGQVAYDDSASYTDGTVGGELDKMNDCCAEVTADVAQLKSAINDLSDFGANNICPFTSAGTSRPSTLTIVSDGKGNYTISGTASSGNVHYNLFSNQSSFPEGIRAGDKILGYIESSNPAIKFYVIWWVNGSKIETDANWVSDGYKYFEIPSTATGMEIRITVPNGTVTNNDIVTPFLFNSLTKYETKTRLDADFEDIETLKSETAYYLRDVTPEQTSGILDRWGNVVGAGHRYSISVNPGEKYELIGYKWGSDYAGYYLMLDNTIVSYDNTTPTGVTRSWNVEIPDGVNTLVLNSNDGYYGSILKQISCPAKPFSKWAGKKIAWFGTSIPEHSSYNPLEGYPEYVAKQLGATVYNEAVGSSTARRGFKTAESASDPYGWTGMGQAALWALGATVEEKNELITNWDSTWRAATGYDVSLTQDMIDKAISCSYENKLVENYINTTPCDLYIFDHGYNDWKSGDIEANPTDPFDRSTYQGAMNTYIKLILEANPDAKIVLISHYEDQELSGLIDMQKGVSDYWNLPFCTLCNKLGWAYDRKVTSTGYWNSKTGGGVWQKSGGATTEYRLTELHMKDGRHPNTDLSGKAIKDIGDIIIEFLNNI